MTSYSDSHTTRPPTLVVGHCHDHSSDHALTIAHDLARRLRARLHIVHAISLADYPVDPEAPDWEERGAADIAEQRHHVEQLLGATSVGWCYEIRHEGPGCALATAAAEQDALLIVVGSRGEGFRRAMDRLTNPSVSHHVISHQHRPVLVVPNHHCAGGGHGALSSSSR